VVHELLVSEPVQAALAERFGAEVAADRSLIAERVFGSEEDRAWLVPLLFESGMEVVFDATIAVVAEETVREERAAARGHAAVAERTGRQLSQQEKADRADFVVRNDGSLDALRERLSLVIAKLEQP
jgi:dephospho-CoA kinase